MTEETQEILMKSAAVVLYIGLGAIVSWIFFYLKRRDLFGGYIGGPAPA